jgi:hypothetical protein
MEGLHKGPRIEVLPEPTQKPGKIYFKSAAVHSIMLSKLISLHCEKNIWFMRFFLGITVAFPYANQRHHQKDHVLSTLVLKRFNWVRNTSKTVNSALVYN